MISNSKVVVTGAAGFIGSHLVRLLVQNGNSVIGIDSLQTGDLARLRDVESQAFQFYHVDLANDLAFLTDEFRDVEVVFHLAAEKLHSLSNQDLRIFDSNVSGLQNLLTMCPPNLRNFVFTSTLYVYGANVSQLSTEGTTLRPTNLYGLSKAFGEMAVRDFFSESNTVTSIARLYFNYGPSQVAPATYQSVIPKTIAMASRGESPTVYGSGQQVLDYIHVEDTVRALSLIAENEFSETFNVSSGAGVSVNDLIAMILQELGSSLSPVRTKPDWTDGTVRVGNSDKLRGLGWRPEISLEQGIHQLVRQHRG